MRCEPRSPRGRRLLVAGMLVLATAIVPFTRVADADEASDPPQMSQVMDADAPEPGGGDADRWWGVAGAALCGLEIRLALRVPAVGLNPYAIAAGLAGCALAALDVFTTN